METYISSVSLSSLSCHDIFLFLITQRVAPGFSSPPSILYLVWGKWKIQNLVQDPKISSVFSSQFQSRVPLSFLTRPRSLQPRTNRTTFESEYTYGHVCLYVRTCTCARSPWLYCYVYVSRASCLINERWVQSPLYNINTSTVNTRAISNLIARFYTFFSFSFLMISIESDTFFK